MAPEHGRGLRGDLRVRVRVPATSGNLGPGFDAFGLAFALYDEVEARTGGTDGEPLVQVDGEGAGDVPRDESHLVYRALLSGLAAAGVGELEIKAARPVLACRNAIPHGRGLGSSAAAVVAGLLAARGLLAEPARLDDDLLLALADEFEGHPDNAAPAILGGFTIAWRPDDAPAGPRAVRIDIHPEVRVVLCLPAEELPTAKARVMLPATVPHQDAAFNVGRGGLLVEALTRRPELLLQATGDRLHQNQRGPAMPRTTALIARLRARGVAAVVSGAGPSVLAFGTGDLAAVVGSVLAEPVAAEPEPAPQEAPWRVLPLTIDADGGTVTTESTRGVK